MNDAENLMIPWVTPWQVWPAERDDLPADHVLDRLADGHEHPERTLAVAARVGARMSVYRPKRCGSSLGPRATDAESARGKVLGAYDLEG